MKPRLFSRMYYILSLIQELGNYFTKSTFQQLLYIFCKEYIHSNIYDFIALNSVPHSFQAEKDLQFLLNNGIISGDFKINVENYPQNFTEKLSNSEKLQLQHLKNDYTGEREWNFKNLIVSKSDIADTDNEMAFYTIGYEGMSIDNYINKLLEENVHVLCDVRRNAFSHKYGFSKNEFAKLLSLVGIKYIHIPEFGISPEHKRLRKMGVPSHILLNEYYEQIELTRNKSIEQLLEIYKRYKRVAITCFEAKSTACHRGQVATFLKAKYDINSVHLGMT